MEAKQSGQALHKFLNISSWIGYVAKPSVEDTARIASLKLARTENRLCAAFSKSGKARSKQGFLGKPILARQAAI
jgi:hypothetical protein